MKPADYLPVRARVLLEVATTNNLPAREIARRLGITERTVLVTIAQLQHEGMLLRCRDPQEKRRNLYEIPDAATDIVKAMVWYRDAVEEFRQADLDRLPDESTAA